MNISDSVPPDHPQMIDSFRQRYEITSTISDGSVNSANSSGLPPSLIDKKFREEIGSWNREKLEAFAAELWQYTQDMGAGAGSITSEHLSSKHSSFHSSPKPPSSPNQPIENPNIVYVGGDDEHRSPRRVMSAVASTKRPSFDAEAPNQKAMRPTFAEKLDDRSMSPTCDLPSTKSVPNMAVPTHPSASTTPGDGVLQSEASTPSGAFNRTRVFSNISTNGSMASNASSEHLITIQVPQHELELHTDMPLPLPHPPKGTNTDSALSSADALPVYSRYKNDDSDSDDGAASDCSAQSYRPHGRRHRPQFCSTANHEVDDQGFETINQYIILEEIGSGAHGVVKKVWDMKKEQLAAVKMIKRNRFRLRRNRDASVSATDGPHRTRDGGSVSTSPVPGAGVSSHSVEGLMSTTVNLAANTSATMGNTSSSTNADEDLQREIAIMKKISNSHIVPMLEAIDDKKSNCIYLVMEFVQGGPILEMLPEAVRKENGPNGAVYKPLDGDKIRNYTRQIVSAMLYLHNRQIIHRDIKPENILVGENDNVFLADFGVSEIVEGNDELNEVTQNAVGTPLYMAPEAVNSQATTGLPGDVWALGVTVYAMATGKLPFSGHNVAEVTEKIVRTEPEYPKDMDTDLKTLIQQMLKKNPDERITVKELRSLSYIKSSAYRHLHAALMSPKSGDDADDFTQVTADDIQNALKPCIPRQLSRAQLEKSIAQSPFMSRSNTPMEFNERIRFNQPE